jgi:signal transduction histidine kinase
MYQTLGTREPAWQRPADLLSGIHIPPSITLKNELGDREIFADFLLERVFGNLVDNSILHGEGVTEIRISEAMKPDCFMIVYEDNGTGIAADEKEKIFERGYGKNSGLGLFLVREILAITAISIRETGEPGRGARFEILVPAGNYRTGAQRPVP